MVEKDAVSKDFGKQVLGYGLTTAEIVYRRLDRPWLLRVRNGDCGQGSFERFSQNARKSFSAGKF